MTDFSKQFFVVLYQLHRYQVLLKVLHRCALLQSKLITSSLVLVGNREDAILLLAAL